MRGVIGRALIGTAEEAVSQLFFRSSGARSFSTFHPRLAPWAAFLRRFAAGRKQQVPPLRRMIREGESSCSGRNDRVGKGELSAWLKLCPEHEPPAGLDGRGRPSLHRGTRGKLGRARAPVRLGPALSLHNTSYRTLD